MRMGTAQATQIEVWSEVLLGLFWNVPGQSQIHTQ